MPGNDPAIMPGPAATFQSYGGPWGNVSNTPFRMYKHFAHEQGTSRIADTIFGSFLEPIGNSINNGIAAEILVNRSLEGGLWNYVNLENLYRE